MTQWNNVTIPSNLYVCQSEKSYKFKLPRHSLYGGYSIWVSKKLILFFEGDYILLYKDNFTFRIIKYGKSKYNWKDILDEKEISAEELLRLKQISGLAALFKDKDFSKAWE